MPKFNLYPAASAADPTQTMLVWDDDQVKQLTLAALEGWIELGLGGVYEADGAADTLMTAHLADGDPHGQYLLETTRGALNGVAPLNAAGKIDTGYLPSGFGGGSGGTPMIDDNRSTVTVSNTTSETSLGTLTIPAGTLQVGDLVEAMWSGPNLSNGSVSSGFQFRVRQSTDLSGTEIVKSDNIGGVGPDSNEGRWMVRLQLHVISTTQAIVTSHVELASVGATVNHGIAANNRRLGVETATIDLDADIPLTASVKLANAHASIWAKCLASACFR